MVSEKMGLPYYRRGRGRRRRRWHYIKSRANI